MVKISAIRRLEKMAHIDVKPVRVWELTEDGRRPWFQLRAGDAAKYADPDGSRYQDYEINWVDPSHPSVRPGQESAKY